MAGHVHVPQPHHEVQDTSNWALFENLVTPDILVVGKRRGISRVESLDSPHARLREIFLDHPIDFRPSSRKITRPRTVIGRM